MLLSVICAFSVFAQQTLTVSGTVKDDAGEPLIGVVVAVAGTGNAAVTDLDGKYTLTKVPSGAKLEASCLGYANVAKPVAEKVDFVLATSTELLSEAVVTGMTPLTNVSLPERPTSFPLWMSISAEWAKSAARLKENQPEFPCRTCQEHSVPLLKSESGAPHPFSAIPSLSG